MRFSWASRLLATLFDPDDGSYLHVSGYQISLRRSELIDAARQEDCWLNAVSCELMTDEPALTMEAGGAQLHLIRWIKAADWQRQN